MANQRHVDILLRGGVKTWNAWRKKESEVRPNLRRANLRRAKLSEANLRRTKLSEADLSEADLSRADLSRADLSEADLSRAHFSGSHLMWADLTKASLTEADLTKADLTEANLSGADLTGADLREAHLSGADLTGAYLNKADGTEADLTGADLTGAHLAGADLTGADLREAHLIGVDLTGADLTGADLRGARLTNCTIYGISAWDVRLNKTTIQKNLRITPLGESAITVDNLEVAQFLYLLLHNDRARAILDTITSKVVLILGRFGEHKAYLDAVREALRSHPNGYIPVLFDFDPQADRSILETVKILAHLARFVIADLTDPRMVRSELQYIVPNAPSVPVQPVVEGNSELLTEYSGWRRDYKSFLRVYRYADLSDLLANLTTTVIEPAEAHVQARRLSDDDPDND